jgi:hypothetical protein
LTASEILEEDTEIPGKQETELVFRKMTKTWNVMLKNRI